MITRKSEQFYGCKDVTNELPKALVKELKKLSNYPVLKVPIRQSGITRGATQQCYWNANIISQTFGGKAVYGWAIDPSKSTGYLINGHGNWLTPEGKLVDVTHMNKYDSDQDENFRYFLPSDEVLVLYGTRTTTMENFVWSDQTKLYALAASCRAKDIWDAFAPKFLPPKYRNDLDKIADLGYEPYCENPVSGELINLHDLPKEKIYKVNAFPRVVVEFISRKVYPTVPKKIIARFFAPQFQEITESTQKQKTYQATNKSFQKLVHEMLQVTLKTGQSLFEQHDGYSATSVFDPVKDSWDDSRITNTPVIGFSTITGKGIEDIPPHKDLVSKYQLPKDKVKKKEILHLAKNFKISPKEFLLLQDPKYFPHPYLCQKAEFKKVTRLKKKQQLDLLRNSSNFLSRKYGSSVLIFITKKEAILPYRFHTT